MREMPAPYTVDPVLDAVAAANYLGLHPETVRLLARQGKLPAAKVGYVWRFRKSALDKMLRGD